MKMKEKSKKTTGKKILAAACGFLIVALLAVGISGTVGDPITRAMATAAIENSLAQRFPGQSFSISRLERSNFMYYSANVQSQSSTDMHFPVSVRGTQLVWDGYADYVESGVVTRKRLSDALTQDAAAVLLPLALPVQYCYANYGAIDKSYGSTLEQNYQIPLDTQYDKNNLIVPVSLDIALLGKTVSWDALATYLLQIDTALAGAGLHFDYYTISLYSEDTYGTEQQAGCEIQAFPAAQLQTKNLAQALQDKAAQQSAAQKAHDAQ